MSRIGKSEWSLVYGVAGILDIIQWLADITGVGAGINEIADPIIGTIFAVYFQMRGVSMIRHISRLFSLMGTTVLEEVTASVAPAWIIDVWYIHSTIRKEEAVFRQQREQESLQSNIAQPLNQGGVRIPQYNMAEEDVPRSLNIDGIRAPGGGLN